MAATYDCAICRDVLGDAPVRALMCACVFHEDCLKTYCDHVGETILEIRCPMCRSSADTMANREAIMIVDVDTDRTETTEVSNAVTPTASEAGTDAEGPHTEAQASLGQQPQVEAQASLGQQPQVEAQASLGQQPQEEAQAVSGPA